MKHHSFSVHNKQLQFKDRSYSLRKPFSYLLSYFTPPYAKIDVLTKKMGWYLWWKFLQSIPGVIKNLVEVFQN